MATESMLHESQELCIFLLGRFLVKVGRYSITEADWRLRKAKHLIKLLALAPNHRCHREQLLEELWPHLDPSAALNNLHRVLHAARRILEPQLEPFYPSSYIHVQGDIIALSPAYMLYIDVEQFEAAANAARQSHEPALYEAALALYTGDLLMEDRYEDWAIRRREQLQQRYLGLLTELAHLYLARQDYDAAIKTLQRLVAEDPTSEEAHAQLMHLYAEMGDQYQALRQYRRLQEALRRELDAEPSMAAQRYYQDILDRPYATMQKRQSGDLTGSGWMVATQVGREREPGETPPLSQREWQIAMLIASGCTNREIGEQLAISQRTVDTHVSHILTKLGFASRMQVTAWVDGYRPGSADRMAVTSARQMPALPRYLPGQPRHNESV